MKNTKEFGEYTNWSGRKTFKIEKEWVVRAIEKQEEDELREYLIPLVRYWGKDFETQFQKNLTNEDLLEAGFMHFELALRTYYEKLEKGKVGFKFSTYFEWFIRKGFLDFFSNDSDKEY